MKKYLTELLLATIGFVAGALACWIFALTPAAKSNAIAKINDNSAAKINDDFAKIKSDLNSRQISEQGYEMYPTGWAINRMDGIIYQQAYGDIGKVLAIEYVGSEFDISINLQGVRGHLVRNGDQYDFYSAARDRIGRLLPCRWSDNGNGWAVFTTIQGYIGHIDRRGDWYLREGCSLMVDLNTTHDWYIEHTKKFELPEQWPAGSGEPVPVKSVGAQ